MFLLLFVYKMIDQRKERSKAINGRQLAYLKFVEFHSPKLCVAKLIWPLKVWTDPSSLGAWQRNFTEVLLAKLGSGINWAEENMLRRQVYDLFKGDKANSNTIRCRIFSIDSAKQKEMDVHMY